MAIVAKLAPCLGGSKGLRIRRGLVARIALSRDNGFMSAPFQEFRLNGGMRIMASRAERLVYGIIAVGLLK